MFNQKNNKFKNFLICYLGLLCFCSIFFISNDGGGGYLSPANNSMHEWLINYQGGFGRRGFLGEIFTQLSLFLNLPLRKTILFFLCFVFIIYFVSVYYFLRSININKTIFIAILSPLFLLFPLAELEALGRKDILIPLFFIFFCYLSSKFNFVSLSIFLIFLYLILLLTHEVSIFYLPFFYAILFFRLEKFEISKLILVLISSFIFIFTIYVLSKSIHTPEKFNLMCDRLSEMFGENCGLGPAMLKRSLSDNIAELLAGFKLLHLIRNSLIFFLGYGFLIILILNTKYLKIKNNLFNRFFSFKFSAFVVFFPTLIPFAIAQDWGRWFNLSYTMLILFYLCCLKDKIIELNERNTFIDYIEKKILINKKFFVILILVVCFSWSPKLVYHDDIGSIPIYRLITKVVKYY